MATSEGLQIAMLAPPNCARVVCSNNYSVSECLAAEVVQPSDYFSPEAWGSEVHPWRTFIYGPAVLAPLSPPGSSRTTHLMMVGDHSPSEQCWVQPNEHMSFTLFDSTRGRVPQLRGRSVAAREAHAKAPGSSTRVLTLTHAHETCSGSILHSLDHANFFHQVREGLASLLYLASQESPCGPKGPPALVRLLAPDTPRYRAWVDALAAALALDAHCAGCAEGRLTLSATERVLFVGAKQHVELEPGSRLYFIDWRRPVADGKPPPKTAIADVSYLQGITRAAVHAVRHAAASSATLFAPGSSCSGDIEAPAVRDSQQRAAETENEVAAVEQNDGSSLVVYVTRNDSSVRRVVGEGALLSALEAAAQAGRPRPWRLLPLALSTHPLGRTARTLARAAVVVGPHGAGLFNAPLFMRATETRAPVLVAFALEDHQREKEDNLEAAADAAGVQYMRCAHVSADFSGDYRLGPAEVQSVVDVVSEALR